MRKYAEGKCTSPFASCVMLVLNILTIFCWKKSLKLSVSRHFFWTTTVDGMCIPGSTAEYYWCLLKTCFWWIQNCKIYVRGPVKYTKIHFWGGNDLEMWLTRPITVVFWVLVWFILMITTVKFQWVHFS